MRSELLVSVVVIAIDRRFLEGTVHPLDLTIRPRVVGFGQAVFDTVGSADLVEAVDRCGIVGCSAYRQSSSGNSVCRRTATTIASSSIDSTVELGGFGPVGRSATKLRLRHLAT